MKTILYQGSKGIRTFVDTLIILVALTGISKGEIPGKELLQNNNELALQLKFWIGNSAFWSTTDNQQADELTKAVADRNANAGNEAGNQELSLEMGSLIHSGSYWDDETATREEEVYGLLKTWISKNAFWSNDADSAEPGVALRMKSWISSGAYWSDETVTGEQDLVGQIKSWIDNGTFWNESNDQLSIGKELACI